MIWIAIALIGIGFLFGGYFMAASMLPGHIGVGKIVGIPKCVIAAVTVSSAIGVALLAKVNGFHLTTLQTGIFVGCLLASFAFHRGLFAATQPKTPWEETLNTRCQVAVNICLRHGWAFDCQAALHQLGNDRRLRFDGGDYDLLAQVQGDFERSMRTKFSEDPLLPDGQIDYDLACARQIATLSGALLGSRHSAGLVAAVANKTDASKLDRAAMDVLLWLGEAVQRQWGVERLYARREVHDAK